METTTTAMAAGRSEVEIFKARNDKREYRRVVLPNSLEVLLISDPDTDKAAASMDVSVGYFCDPDGLEGLAHFLEHMLFYASEKYPVEDSFSKYTTEHGGSTNAFTSSEHTNFHFDVNADCLEEALDRFAQFFIKPLMSPDATLREIKAVDSENQNNLLSDHWRMSQLQKHLTSKNHPYHKFSTGNWDTLEVKAKSRGIDTRLELIKFYEKSYSANLMHLVLYGREGLVYLQSLVERLFGDIRNIGRDYFNFPGQPCSSEHLQILVKAVRIKEGHILRVMWPTTPSIHNYNEGPCSYISHLIGHEGEGSLFYILKQLGWAISLQAGEGDWSSEFSFFTIVIKLTDKGHEHVEDVVGLLFRYIFLLKNNGISQWIFDELVAISETDFHYQDKVPPADYVVNISSNMKIFPPKDWLVGSCLPSKFVPSTIQRILDELTPGNVRIFWESKMFEGYTNSVEPWYGTTYSIEKFTDSMIQRWVDKAPNVNLHLPNPNVFIPSSLTLQLIQEKAYVPILLRKSQFSKLWYKPDTMFSTPKAYIMIAFNCPHSNLSPESVILTGIYTSLIMDYLNEYAYDAQLAGLYYALHQVDTGFQVIVYGYNDKMKVLLDAVIVKIRQFEVKPNRFAVIKESLMKYYQNFKFQQPYEQALYYFSLLLEDQTWPWNDEFEVLPHLEVSDLTKFSSQLLEKTFLECYVGGNIHPSEAESIIKNIEEKIFKDPQYSCRPLFPSEYLTDRIVKLERGTRCYYPVGGLNNSDENSALLHYIQVHQDDTKLNVKLELFALIANQPAFHQLRSVEQLGYITMFTKRNDSGIRGVQFIIQSTVQNPSNLNDRVDAFLKMFETTLYELTDEEFKSNVTALIDMKLEKHKNLWEESEFYWDEICSGTLKFDRRESEVEALKGLSKEELIDFFNNHIKIDAPKRKSLSVLVYGSLHSSEYKKLVDEADTPETYQIRDVFGFRRSRPLYGSCKGGVGQMTM